MTGRRAGGGGAAGRAFGSFSPSSTSRTFLPPFFSAVIPLSFLEIITLGRPSLSNRNEWATAVAAETVLKKRGKWSYAPNRTSPPWLSAIQDDHGGRGRAYVDIKVGSSGYQVCCRGAAVMFKKLTLVITC